MIHLAPWALGILTPVAFIAALCGILMPTGAAGGQDLASAIVGVWKPVSLETKEVLSGKAVRPLGDVTGNFVFTRGGQFLGIVLSANRQAPAAANATEAERVALFNSMVSYYGVYQVSGNKLVLTIENSHIQSWNGTQRSFTVTIDDTQLTGRSSPLKAATTGLDVFAEFVWQRIE